MADNARPPVAVRIIRPYDTEEAFLESELETVGKTSVILIGAHARPTGVILRFEVTLANGSAVLRGEGRVLAHKENAFRGQSGLALRFTRLDPKSKGLVDRAAAIREARLSSDSMRPPAESPSGPSIPVAAASSAPAATSTSAPPARASGRPPGFGSHPPGSRFPSGGPPPSGRPSEYSTRTLSPSAPPPSMLPGMHRSAPPAPDADYGRSESSPSAPPAPSPDPILASVVTTEATPAPPSPPVSEQILVAEESRPQLSTLVDEDEEGTESPPPPPPPPAPQARARPVVEAAGPLAAPPDRDDLLGRLRARASRLSDEQTAEILRRG